jgi:hypothetical protein
MKLDIKALNTQVKVNCDISDARFWGTYSICGLLSNGAGEVIEKELLEKNVLPGR